MVDWIAALHNLGIALALGGGGVAMLAYLIRRRELRQGRSSAQRAHIAFLTSYILMSLSIFCMALGGLLG
jgi:uncharacterized membrane protein YidH (DUF202 family)